MIVAAVVLYILGALVTAGVIGGVRDEMDGIGDMAIIVFWPVALAWGLLSRVSQACFALGRWTRRNQ